MSNVRRWRDTDHLERAVDAAGGQEPSTQRLARCSMTPAAGGWPSFASGAR